MFTKIGRLISELRRNTGGNAALLVAIGMPAIIGGGGLAVDTSQWYMWKRELQFAADQGALAGAWARTDSATSANYTSRASQEYNANLEMVEDFDGAPTITLVNHGTGTNNAVQVVATASKSLPFSGMLTGSAASVRVSARATFAAGATYSGCMVATHPSMQGAFTLGGNASGGLACGVTALSNHATAALVKNGNSDAALGQLVAAGGIDGGFSNNGTLHPNTAGLTDPFAGISEPAPDPSPARTYSCPSVVAGSSTTTVTKTTNATISYVYVTANNSNQALNNAIAGTNVITYTPSPAPTIAAGAQTPIVENNLTVTSTTPPASETAYTYTRQVSTSPRRYEVMRTVRTVTYSNINTVTTPGSDGTANLEPGTYGAINIECNTVFAPGIYVVDSIDFGNNHDVSGDNVLFVLKTSASIHINANSRVDLSGITKDTLTSTYGYGESEAEKLASMIFYDVNSTDRLTINGNSDILLDGILYMPNREVKINGTAAASGNDCMMIVGQQITFTGTVDLSNFCIPGGAVNMQTGGGEAEVKLVA